MDESNRPTNTPKRCSNSCEQALYLECLAELVAHDGVEQRVDAGGQVVEHPGNVSHDRVNRVDGGTRVSKFFSAVNCHQALRMERGPAEEEGDHHRDWRGLGRNGKKRIQNFIGIQR